MPRRATPPPFPTSEDAYNRIMWDDRFDSSDYEIGYMDRFRGMMFLPLVDFRRGHDEVSEIPYHRVYLIRFTASGVDVWDREKRVCLLDSIADGTFDPNPPPPPPPPAEEAAAAEGTQNETDGVGTGATSSSSSSSTSSLDASVGTEGTSAMVMEMPQWGNKLLEPYPPQDALEQWLLRHTVTEFARDCPTHISQLGAMYHIPSTHDMFQQFLAVWEETLKSDCRFYVEEIRGSVFRLYIDIDLKSSTAAAVPFGDILPHIVTFTRSCYSSMDTDATVVITECHGEYEDSTNPEVHYKSGYRLYFTDLFIEQTQYKPFLESLVSYVGQRCAVPSQCVHGTTWADVFDTHGAVWDRARLFGTVKRRKALARRYAFQRCVRLAKAHTGTDAALEDVAAKTDEFKHNTQSLLLSTNVRLWDSPLLLAHSASASAFSLRGLDTPVANN